MPLSDRTITVGSPWANGAPDIGGSPAQGTTYRNSALSQALITAGWPFDIPVASSTMNEMLFRLSILMFQIETFGTLLWSTLTAYQPPAKVIGSDSNWYTAIADSQGVDPTTDNGTHWQADLPLGFVPVQQGGGYDQGNNKIYLGLDGTDGNHIRAQIGSTDKGKIAYVTDIPPFSSVNPSSLSWPEILQPGNVLSFNPGAGSWTQSGGNLLGVGPISIPLNQAVLFRDSFWFSVSSPSSAPSFPTTGPAAVYHLRLAYRVDAGGVNAAADNMGVLFYEAKGITAGSYYLVAVNDPLYNPSNSPEKDPSLDTKRDDMLCAKIIADGSNNLTVTPLINTNNRLAWSNQGPHTPFAFPTTLQTLSSKGLISQFVSNVARQINAEVKGNFDIDCVSTADVGWIKIYKNGSILLCEGCYNGTVSGATGGTVIPSMLTSVNRGDVIEPYFVRTTVDSASLLLNVQYNNTPASTDLSELGASLAVTQI